MNKIAINMYLSIITLNVKGINVAIKKHRTSLWMDKKARPTYMLSIREPLQNEGYTQTKSKGMEKDISCKLLT